MEHNASLSGAITAMRQDEQQRIAEVEDRIKQDEEVCNMWLRFQWMLSLGWIFFQVKRNAELQRQMQDLDVQKQEAVLKERENVDSIAKQMDVLKNVGLIWYSIHRVCSNSAWVYVMQYGMSLWFSQLAILYPLGHIKLMAYPGH